MGSSDRNELSIRERQLPEVKAGTSLSLSLDPQHAGRFVYADGPDVGQVFADVDVIFPVLHGRFGEDGTVQGLFDMASVPYVGAGVLASAASMDKEFTKKLAAAEGLPIGRDVVLRETRSLTEEEKNLLGLPVFVKPARGGSSIGISKVDQWDELDDALDLARQHDSKVIVESMIVGTEVECGVLQRPDGTVEASLPAQLEDTESGDEGFYGFDTKYLDNVITAQIPPHFDDDTIRHIRELAVETFHALDCEGLARVDFFVTDRGPVLNEINTMPGFTPISMYRVMWEESGIPYGQGMVKNAYVGRTFIQPTQTLRQLGIRLKLNPVREVIEGKRLVVVDDSIVRGNTQRALVKMLREAGVAEVHIRISSPPVMWPCFYGIDFATRAELIATGMSVEEIRESVGADTLGYLSVDGMVEASGQPADSLCMACFTGTYPMRPPAEGIPIGTLPISRVPSVYRRRHDSAPVAVATVGEQPAAPAVVSSLPASATTPDSAPRFTIPPFGGRRAAAPAASADQQPQTPDEGTAR